MGVPNLKVKSFYHYRRGNTKRHCNRCCSFTVIRIPGVGSEDPDVEPRCRVFGLKPGRMYRVHPFSVCDCFEDLDRQVAQT